MSLWKIAWRSVQQRAVASSLTAISMALGVALVVIVLVIQSTINNSFKRSAQGYDLIVGAKGGKLQLVLNTVYHLSTPVENIPYSYYKEFTQGRFAKDVDVAIPYCLGDNYEGYRVVGTTPAMFNVFKYAEGRSYTFAAGRNFEHDNFFEAVIGSLVARRTGLKVGDQFQPTHGVSEDSPGHKHDAFTVVGVLSDTGTPNDRALFVNMEGFFLLRGHAKEPGKIKPAPSGKVPASKHADEKHDHEAHDHDSGKPHHHEPGEADPEEGSHNDADHHHGASEPEANKDESHGHEDHDHKPGTPHDHKDGEADHEEDGHKHADHDHDTAESDAKNLQPEANTDEDHDHEIGTPHEHGDADNADDGHKHADHDHGASGAEAHERDSEKPHEHETGHAEDGHAVTDHEHDDAHDHAEHDHAEHEHGHSHTPLPEDQREVTAILVRTNPKNLLASISLPRIINKESVAQAVQPAREIYNLFDSIVGNLQKLLLVLAVLVVIVAGIGIMVSIYNSMSDRRREIAIMRSLGARRQTVLNVILLESILLSVGGGLAGWLLGHTVIGLLSPLVVAHTGVSLSFLEYDAYELVLAPGLIVLASIVGFLPAITAYKTDVASALSGAP